MGFTPPSTVYHLMFEDADHPMHGFECDVRGLSIQEIITPRTKAGDIELFVSRVNSWNLEDSDGNPLPVTVDSVNTLELRHVSQILGAWVRGATSVDDFLPPPSKDGEPSPAENFPMAPLSPSLSSLDTPSGSSTSFEGSPGTPSTP